MRKSLNRSWGSNIHPDKINFNAKIIAKDQQGNLIIILIDKSKP